MAKVLLVDDEPTVRRIMRVALEKAGFDVEIAPNGEAALEILRERVPDVLITDIEMPRMDGRALCATVEKEFVDRKFPIFVLTSLTEREHRVWSSRIDNLWFMEKPVSVRNLIARLNHYFGRDNATAEAGR